MMLPASTFIVLCGWLAGICVVSALYLFGNKSAIGLYFLMWGEVLWVIVGASFHLWSLVVFNVVLFAFTLRAAYNWKITGKRATQ